MNRSSIYDLRWISPHPSTTRTQTKTTTIAECKQRCTVREREKKCQIAAKQAFLNSTIVQRTNVHRTTRTYDLYMHFDTGYGLCMTNTWVWCSHGYFFPFPPPFHRRRGVCVCVQQHLPMKCCANTGRRDVERVRMQGKRKPLAKCFLRLCTTKYFGSLNWTNNAFFRRIATICCVGYATSSQENQCNRHRQWTEREREMAYTNETRRITQQQQ